ncbi:MAG: VWA domain-containing protein, partial [Planctomycetota bacterium]|nr:VWA domain-containing protein [Planctomycetota bacterium]
MFGDLPIQFDRPGWLVLLILIVPVYLMARRSIGGLSRTKANITFAVRAVVILLLTAALARPVWEKRGEGLTVTVILDRSQSIPLPLKRSSLDFLRRATEAKRHREDRLAVITVAKDATIVAMPDKFSALGEVQEPADLDATNLAAAIRLALAIMPDDTANRIVLASDGNETEDSVLAAAELAKANDVRIDVLVLQYEHTNEVIFERIAAPARARLGQSANIKLVLRSQGSATGRITLRMNEQYLDLNGAEEGNALSVALEPGLTVIPVTISLESPGPVQFDAVFEADRASDDGVSMNNRAVAVTFVGGEGKVLIIDDGAVESQYLVAALTESDIAVDIQGTESLARGAVHLSGYDAVVLANIPRYAITDEDDRTLHAYVHDLGGGLVMLGGPQSFGAGGWIDSEVAKVLPVKLDPPQTRQMVKGALALIMHSTEMPQGNFW